MVAIESTPEMATAVYATMARNLAVVRRRLGRPLTLADKILLGHLDDPEHQELEPGNSYLLLRPDRVVFQDVLGQTGLLQFMQTRRDKVAVPATIHCDHLIQARVEGAADLREVVRREQGGLRFSAFGSRQVWPGLLGAGRRHHPPGGARKICIPRRVDHRHRLAYSQCRGSRCMRGRRRRRRRCRGHRRVALGGALSETHRGLSDRQLSGWTAPKDVILYVAGQLTVSGATNAIVEYIGPGARDDQRHRQGDDHQYGGRARRHDIDVPGRRAHGEISAGDRQGQSGAADRAEPAPAGTRHGGRGRSRRNTTTASSSSICPSSSPMSSVRIRPTEPARSRGSPPRSPIRRMDSSTRSRRP